MRIRYIFLTGILYLLTLATCTFFESKGCAQLVIDTYEVYAEIDIPRTSYVNCYYDENAMQRITVFELKRPLSLDKFERTDSAAIAMALPALSQLNEEELPKEGDFHRASGEKWGVKWYLLYDQASDRFWAELDY